jgi:hypothetical protein
MRVAPGRQRSSARFAVLGALAAAFALATAVPAIGQRAEQPVVKAGDAWWFAVYFGVPTSEPSRHWVITSITPTMVAGTENGEPLTLTPELNVLESPRTRESNPKALSFPLEVGKRWRFDSDWLFKPKGSKGSTSVEVTVLAYEKITVPGGEFDAFKLVATGRLRGTSPINSRYDGETTTTYWYAPAARAVVRSVAHNPYLGTTTVELVGLHLQR